MDYVEGCVCWGNLADCAGMYASASSSFLGIILACWLLQVCLAHFVAVHGRSRTGACTEGIHRLETVVTVVNLSTI